MGFDNDCIISIQSLAGEYFCPVCRLLVYPNEALQSQCTHLYCKPCLTYVVSTTRACPYDGYLVAEADSKPLTESNKALAETIGKIPVHCLYHRSGCTWQGPLSECTSHCSGCTFGNSPVVCNRCGVQIVHRQVQEHAQSCPGVQAQIQQADAAKETAPTAPAAAADKNPATTQVGTPISLTQPSQGTATPMLDPKLQATSGSQAQAATQAAVPTHEQWYQQQQYQQYYQQYAGYDPYQQHYQQYYPYQQQAVAQYQQQHLQAHPTQVVQQHPQPYVQPPLQPQSQPQTQSQPQIQPLLPVQTQVASQTHSHTQVNQQQQNYSATQPHIHKSQTQPLPQGNQNPQPQPPLQSVQPPQMPQYEQPYSLTQQSQSLVHPLPHSQHHPLHQSQPHPQAQAQAQPHPQAQAQPHPHPHPQAQPQPHPQNQFQPQPHSKSHSQPTQPLNPSVPPAQNPSAPAVTGYHSYPQMQPHPQFHPQMHLGTTHQPPVLVPPQGGSQQQSQFPQPPHMRLPQPHAPLYQQPQSMLPLHGQAPSIPPAQQQSVQPNLQKSGHNVQQHPTVQPVAQPPPQQFVQQQHFGGQPSGLHQGPFVQQPIHSQLRSQAPSHLLQQHQGYPQPQQHGMQPHQSQNLGGRPLMLNQVQSQPYLQPSGGSLAGVQARPVQLGTEGSKVEHDFGAGSDHKSNVDNTKSIKSEKAEEINPMGEVEDKSSHAGTSTKVIPDSEVHVKENGDALSKQAVKEEPGGHALEQPDCRKSGEVSASLEEHFVVQDKEVQDEKSAKLQKVSSGQPPTSHGALTLQQRPSAPSMLQAPPTGLPQHKQVPAHPRDQHSLQGPGNGPEISSGPGSTASFGRVPTQFGPQSTPQQMYDQGRVISSHSGPFKPSQNEPVGGHGPGAFLLDARDLDGMMARARGPDGYMGQQRPPYPMESAPYANQRSSYMDCRQPDVQLPGSSERGPYGQPPGVLPNAMRTNGPPELETYRDDRFKPFPDERLNPFPMDPARRDFEDDLKKFPRPSHLGDDPVPQFGSSFPPSRPLDVVPRGFGDIGPRPLDRGHKGGHYYDGRPAPGSVLNPYCHGVNEAEERSAGLREDIRPDSAHTYMGFHGPSHDRPHIDGFPPRSPPREYPGISSHGFGGLRSGPRRQFGLEEMDAREPRRFGDPFRESRFSSLPNRLHRGEFDSPGNFPMGEHFRSGDFPHDTLHRGEYMGQHNLPSNLRMGDPVGFEEFPGHGRMGGMPGFRNFPRHPGPPGEFIRGSRQNHPKIGEPGFRSSFILQGDVEPFENPRKRKPVSMGWCRICKVDCETVEGLDLHSQTREHQKMAMDMVREIKQNAKKHKLKSSDHSSVEEAGRSRSANSEAREIKS